jgi:hypothetical protein
MTLDVVRMRQVSSMSSAMQWTKEHYSVMEEHHNIRKKLYCNNEHYSIRDKY